MKGLKGKINVVTDGCKGRTGAESRSLMMKSSVRCTSMAQLMKGKQQRYMPVVSPHQPPLRGVCYEQTEEKTEWRQRLHRQKDVGVGSEEKQTERGWSLEVISALYSSRQTGLCSVFGCTQCRCMYTYTRHDSLL